MANTTMKEMSKWMENRNLQFSNEKCEAIEFSTNQNINNNIIPIKNRYIT